MTRKMRSGIITPILVILISILNFFNFENVDCIRPIHIATLVLCGMGIGVLMVNLIRYFRKEE